MIKILLRLSLMLSLMVPSLMSHGSDVDIIYLTNTQAPNEADYKSYDSAYVARLEEQGYTVTTSLYSDFTTGTVADNASAYDLIVIGYGTDGTAAADIAALNLPVLLQAQNVNVYGFANKTRKNGGFGSLAYTSYPKAASAKIANGIAGEFDLSENSEMQSIDTALDTFSDNLIQGFTLTGSNAKRVPVVALEAGSNFYDNSATTAARRGYFGIVNSNIAFSKAADDNLAQVYNGMIKWLLGVRTITASSGMGGTIDPAGAIEISSGGSRTFTFTPEDGFLVEEVIVDGMSQGVLSDYTFDNVSADHTISVSFVNSITHDITASVQGPGSISPSGVYNTSDGFDETFTFTADPGFELAEIIVDGVSQLAQQEYTLSGVSMDHTIVGVFQPKTSLGANILYALADTYTSTYKVDGVDVTYTYSDVDEQYITQLEEDGNTVTTIAYSALTTGIVADNVTGYDMLVVGMDTDGSSAGDIAALDLPILLQANDVSDYGFGNATRKNGVVGSISYTSNPSDISAAIANGLTAELVFPGNSETQGLDTEKDGDTQSVDLVPLYIVGGSRIPVAVMESGATYDQDAGTAPARRGFFGVVNSGAAMSTELASVYLNMAKWLMNINKVSASANAGGTIFPSGESEVLPGGTQAFEITVDEGYELVDVLVNDASIGIQTEYLFTNVTSDQSIAANFEIITYEITASTGANGTISPLGVTEVDYASSQAYTMVPDEGYRVLDVSVDGGSVGAVDSYTFEDVKETHIISVTFEAIPQYEITSSAGDNGSISPAGSTMVYEESSQEYIITSDDTYRILDVLVDGVSVGVVNTYTFDDVKEAHTISATFELIPLYEIVATAGENGSITPNGTAEWEEGEDIAFSIEANTGYNIADVLVDGASVGAVSSYTFEDLDEAHTIAASFVIQTFDITATAGGNGTISPESTTSVDYGSNQTFTITPAEGYEVEEVTVDGKSLGAIDTYTFENVMNPHTISVTFEKKMYLIVATANENGSISPAELVVVGHGDDQSFTIAADEGYEIADVKVNNESVGAVSSYTFEKVTGAQSITATFREIVVVTEVNPTLQKAQTIYPNPSNGSFTIDTAGSGEVYILTVDGKLVNILKTSGSLSVSGLDRGTYLIQSRTKNGLEIQRLIVK